MSKESRPSLTPEALLSDTFKELLTDYENKTITQERILRELDETKTILEKTRRKIQAEGYIGYKLPPDLRHTLEQIQKQQNRLFGAMRDVNQELTQLEEALNALDTTTKVGVPKPAEA